MGPKLKGTQWERGERWVFTMPRRGIDDEVKLEELQDNKEVQYLIVGAEIGDETNYHHWQGYIQFLYQKSRCQVKKLLTNEAHLEKAQGGLNSQIRYCSKQGNVKYKRGLDENLQPPKLKKLNKTGSDDHWIQIIRDAESMTSKQFKNEHAKEWLLRRQAIERIMIDNWGKKAKTWNGDLQDKNLWIWGSTGLGKSRWANAQAPAWATMKKNINKWWCGYEGEGTRLVLIEDYPNVSSGGNCLCHHIKLWADRYPFQGETKGSSSLIQPGRFCLVVTSNFPIEQCFSNQEDVAAISRRFKQIELTKKNQTLIRASKLQFSKLEGGVDEILGEPDCEVDMEWWKDQWRHEEEVKLAREESMDIDEARQEAIERGELEEEEEW
jgi:hypothetical protein